MKTDFPASVDFKSISKCIVNEDHVDSVSVSGESGDQELTADGIHGFCSQSICLFLCMGYLSQISGHLQVQLPRFWHVSWHCPDRNRLC